MEGRSMKHRTISTKLVIVFIAGLFVGVETLEAKDNRGCSTAATAGDWAFTDTGSIIGIGPFGAIGTFTLDEAGNVVGEQTNSVNGNVSRLTFSGPYTVNADCTGSSNLDIFDSS